MINADVFENTFGIYATELWAKPEDELLKWLNTEYKKTDWIITAKGLMCTKCTYITGTLRELNFCPNCGKPMLKNIWKEHNHE